MKQRSFFLLAVMACSMTKEVLATRDGKGRAQRRINAFQREAIKTTSVDLRDLEKSHPHQNSAISQETITSQTSPSPHSLVHSNPEPSPLAPADADAARQEENDFVEVEKPEYEQKATAPENSQASSSFLATVTGFFWSSTK